MRARKPSINRLPTPIRSKKNAVRGPNGPLRVIPPVCCRTSATPGKLRALSHDDGKQPEVTGGFRASQLIETGGARAHAERREADDDSPLLGRALNAREKITERKRKRREDKQGTDEPRRRFPTYPYFLRASGTSRGAIIPRMTSVFCCVACAASLSLARSSISKLISASRLGSSTASASNFR